MALPTAASSERRATHNHPRGESLSFSDQMLLKSHYVIRLLIIFGVGALDERRGLAITAECVRTFFDVYSDLESRTIRHRSRVTFSTAAPDNPAVCPYWCPLVSLPAHRKATTD